MKKDNNQKLILAIGVALTLGLAPFIPEPHLYGKLRWLFGGANGMQSKDYFDLVLHGFPWIYLVIVIINKVIKR